jgi:hypothetical protein
MYIQEMATRRRVREGWVPWKIFQTADVFLWVLAQFLDNIITLKNLVYALKLC